MPKGYHIRFPYTGSLLDNTMGPLQHAIWNNTLKTFCGVDASNWCKIDDKENAPITCEKCKRKKALLLPRYYECGICAHLHAVAWKGDCRDDANRFNIEDLEAKHGVHGFTIVPMGEV